MRFLVLVALLWAALLLNVSNVFAATCEGLATLALADTEITSAKLVGAGEFVVPGGRGPGRGEDAAQFRNLPAFCRVQATLRPSKDSDIRTEIWLPAAGWNGNFQAATSGGAGAAVQGEINFGGLAAVLRAGYAAGATDLGHQGATLDFALAHPERLTDFGYRAFHEMTVKAKAVTAEFYGKNPGYAYLNACAAGARTALMEAQRFPADYDGIVAGAPANDWINLQTWSLWVYTATHQNEASYIPPADYTLLHKAAVEACDANDGVKDGVIEDPTRCRFDPEVLACKGSQSTGCLTAPQMEAARKIYSPAINPRTKAQIFPGLEPGSELGWGGLASGDQAPLYVRETFKYVVFADPGWDYKKRPIDYDQDLAHATAMDHGTITASNPNLKDFFARGGKLIQYHGWSDPLIAPGHSVDYFNQVTAALGGAVNVRDSLRLYMVPGMNHCRGGEGTDTFDMQGAIERWVEKGEAPGTILASRVVDGSVQRTRPLCPYPQIAKYNGVGSTAAAASFACRLP